MEEDGFGLLRCCSHLVGAVLEDSGDGLVGAGVEQESAGARGVDTLPSIVLHKPENPDGRTEALFGMGPRAQDDLDQRVGVGSDLGGLTANALMCPVTVAPMRTRHMLGD